MYNSVTLIGRLVDDPKIATYDEQCTVSNITLACNRPFKNSDGQMEVDFIRVSLWDTLGRNTYDYCRKGDMVAIRGRIQNRKSEITVDTDNGPVKKNIQTYDVVGERIIFLSTTGIPSHSEEAN